VHAGKDLDAIKAFYNGEFNDTVDEYFKFLEEQEFGFWTDEAQSFPPINLEWSYSDRITNALIDIDDDSQHDYTKIFLELDDLGCKAVELRFFGNISVRRLRKILQATKLGRLRSIDLLLKHTKQLSFRVLADLCIEHKRINRIIVHSSPHEEAIEVGSTETFIAFYVQTIDSPSCCGQVDARYFSININSFVEAHQYNSCLNRKVSIDSRGEIRNCPSLPYSYGNIAVTSLHNAVTKRDFSDIWLINKDQIEICKDCEFRYMCPDCRAFIRDDKGIYSKPSKCRYDPYTAKWT